MLKRLFISILILSALASEGIVNPSVEFYNLLLCSEMALDLLNHELVPAAQMQEASSSKELICDALSNEFFTITAASVQKFECKNLPCVVGPLETQFIYPAVKNPDVISYFKSCSEGTLLKSDTSPPCIIV